MTDGLDNGQVVAARYALQRPLGRSLRGETWLARDAVSGREVVLKFASGADAEAVQRLERELAVHAQLQHPAVLPPGRLEHADGRAFSVMEYLPGGDLSRLRGRAWPFVLRRLLPVVEALGALHARGFVHCDVKSANVLLDADGLARLADFSSARPIGTRGTAEGSPYGMSPQRYAGEPAAVTDDVYSVGVLVYKLVGGYPPFYPEVSAERVRSEVPAPLVGRPPVPAPLAELVARCLSKDPSGRPQDMTELGRALRECLDLPVVEEPAAPRAEVPPLTPPAEVAPIRASWQRASPGGPSDRELRSEGFRRGLMVSGAVLSIAAVVFVFFVLPGLVSQPSPREAPAAGPATPAPASATRASLPTDEADLEKVAEQKRQVDERRARLGERLAALERKDVAAWGGSAVGDARGALATADGAIGRREYSAAAGSLGTAEQAIAGLEQRVPVVLRQLLADGNAALDAGRSAEAADRFSAALRIDASSAAATAGMKRARSLDEVLKELSAAARAEQSGDPTAALAAYQRALRLDPATRAARDGVARLQASANASAFSAAMSQGLSALARQDYPAARAAFERAGRLRPGAPEVADGLRQVEQAGHNSDINAILSRGRAAERDERWGDALAAYRDALKSDAALVDARQGVDRSEPRAMLDAQLQTYLERPDRLFSAEGRAAARSILAQTQAVSAPGPRLAGQVQRLGQLVQQAETPIRIGLTSDNLTDVQIYRVGRLGAFEHRDLELLPGRYTVVGTRNGYRDVRKEFSLLPGAPPPQVVVRCEEPI